jgi:ubiquinone/menaquinone biosynthesis C-methylase UbiE
MPETKGATEDQVAFWNGAGARNWPALQAKQDLLFAPITAALFARAQIKHGERVLDVGCGCGETTIEIARRVGATGKAIGLDVSEPLVREARRLAGEDTGVEFILADATTHAFAPASLDALISRFGVMFFGDPVAAFVNLRCALKPRARAVFVCWREVKQNEWVMVPLRAALRHLPRLPERGPEEPGPFSFGDEARLRRILDAAGFARLTLTPLDLPLDLAVGGGLESALHIAQTIGPASRTMEGQPDSLRAAAIAEIRSALAPYQRGEAVPLGGAIWIVEAVNS